MGAAGAIAVTAANVSGTTGVIAANAGVGAVSVTTNGTVTGTVAEGIKATGNGAVSVAVAGTVTGATLGLSLTGGTGGAGNILVTGTGGFAGGTGDAANIKNNGSGTVTLNVSGASSSTGGNGIFVRDTAAGGNISVTAGAVTALTANKNGIDVITSTLTGNLTEVANGDVKAGNAGLVGAIVAAAATGNIAVTANGATTARFGIDAENFGSGATTVTTVGPVTATSGNGIFALATGGNVTVTAADVTATGNTAIIAQQTKIGAAGAIAVTARNVSGTTGIDATNRGTGATSVTANGTITGTAAEGIKATGSGAVSVAVAGTVTGATRGLSLVGGTIDVTNSPSGTIRNISGLSSDAAIQATGGSVTLTNGGSIVGTVQFTSAATLFTNNGSWNGAGATSDFTGAGSTLVNAGTLVGGNASGTAEVTILSNLTQLTNRGLMTMVDGGAGDVIRQTGGNASFQAGSILAIDVNTVGQADRFTTTGTATLTGTSLVLHGGLAVGNHYTVLTADIGLTGTFTSITLPSAFLGVKDSYDAFNAYLDVLVSHPFVVAGLTPNQIATGRGLDSIPQSGTLFNAVANLATFADARAAFDSLSGEVHASAQTALIEESHFVRDAMNDRLRQSFAAVAAPSMPMMAFAADAPASSALAYAMSTKAPPRGALAPAPTYAIWGQAFGSWGHTDGDGNAARLSRSTGGMVSGFDAIVGETWRAGVLGGYSHTSFDVSDRASSGQSDNYHVGLYGGTQWGALGFRSGAAYTWHDIGTARSVAFPGFTDNLKADYHAATMQVFGEFGYRVETRAAAFEPYANLAYVNLRREGFSERGGAAALTSTGENTGTAFTTFGLRASTAFAIGTVKADLRGTVGWRHAFDDVTPFSTFAFAGGSAFNIAGVPIARDAAVVDAGLDFAVAKGTTVGIFYNGQFGNAAADQSIRGNFVIKF
ncbi:autotransporter domain-containing protein [Bradyrhizobium sp. SSUT77]|uniref:autotransporter outer membrane beta-barrel domain-containing protein n=1 Tax=Bradyrhizobium sp. SSUT77 TaxID=3040603 RepID=UPI00244A96E8|nr:autotransporter domain-containing protein [Bradyrhizobium sp. SSUT77]